MTVQPEILAAAQRILDGDWSAAAAERLEGLIVAHGWDEQGEPWDELVYNLAMYEPFQGPPYAGPADLRAAIRYSPIFNPDGPVHDWGVITISDIEDKGDPGDVGNGEISE
jgi:hypothetical protein